MAANPRYDPERRDRIIDACLDVIAANEFQSNVVQKGV